MSGKLFTIGVVQFADADNRALLSNFILIATLVIILYVALFVNEEKEKDSSVEKRASPSYTPTKNVTPKKTARKYCMNK